MNTKEAFGTAFRKFRIAKGRTYREFGPTKPYIRLLESGNSSPTLDKIAYLAEIIGVHPATLVIQAFLNADNDLSIEELISIVQKEIDEVNLISDTKSSTSKEDDFEK